MNLRERYAKWRENERKGNELVEVSVTAPRFILPQLVYYSNRFHKSGVLVLFGLLMLEWFFMGAIFGYCFSKMSFGGLLFLGSIGFLVVITAYELSHSGKAKRLVKNNREALKQRLRYFLFLEKGIE